MNYNEIIFSFECLFCRTLWRRRPETPAEVVVGLLLLARGLGERNPIPGPPLNERPPGAYTRRANLCMCLWTRRRTRTRHTKSLHDCFAAPDDWNCILDCSGIFRQYTTFIYLFRDSFKMHLSAKTHFACDFIFCIK